MKGSFAHKVKIALEIASIVLTIAVCIMLLWRGWAARSTKKAVATGGRSSGNQTDIPATPVSVDGASLRGSPGAPVVLIVFSDFQCPFCAKFAQGVWPELDRQYVQPGKLLVAFRHMPLAIHPWARAAAAAAECAGQQGRFWQMHDLLFADQAHLDYESLRQRAVTLGLKAPIFERCLSESAAQRIQADLKEAASLVVSGTPTFLLGTHLEHGRVIVSKRLVGPGSLGAFKAAIDAAAATRGSFPADAERQN